MPLFIQYLMLLGILAFLLTARHYNIRYKKRLNSGRIIELRDYQKKNALSIVAATVLALTFIFIKLLK